jgi:hypothetical protein
MTTRGKLDRGARRHSLCSSCRREIMETQFMMLHGGYVSVSCFNKLLQLGTWCSGITSASHAEGPGFNPLCVHIPLVAFSYALITIWFHLGRPVISVIVLHAHQAPTQVKRQHIISTSTYIGRSSHILGHSTRLIVIKGSKIIRRPGIEPGTI